MKNAMTWLPAQGVKSGLVTLGFVCISVIGTLFFVIRFSMSLNPTLLVILAFGINTVVGAGWVVAMMRLLGEVGRETVWLGSLRWGASIIVAMLALGAVNQLAHYLYDWRYPYDPVVVGAMFAVSFSIAVGLVSLANVRGLLGHLGRQEEKQQVGERAGLAAGVVFALAVLVLHLWGWKVGAPPGVAFKMSKVVAIAGALAAFAGGYVLGWSTKKKTDKFDAERV